MSGDGVCTCVCGVVIEGSPYNNFYDEIPRLLSQKAKARAAYLSPAGKPLGCCHFSLSQLVAVSFLQLCCYPHSPPPSPTVVPSSAGSYLKRKESSFPSTYTTTKRKHHRICNCASDHAKSPTKGGEGVNMRNSSRKAAGNCLCIAVTHRHDDVWAGITR